MRSNWIVPAFLVLALGCGGSSDPKITGDTLVPPLDTLAGGDDAVASEVVCTPRDHRACCGDAICWFDDCGNAGVKILDCASGCADARCKDCSGSCAGKQCGEDGCGGECGTCGDGTCAGGAWTSPPECNGGMCTGGGSVLSCDDGEACTDDSCDPRQGCLHAANTAACEDGDPCTTSDRCETGTCKGGAAATCDDQNPCTLDSCLKGYGCKHVNEADGTMCQVGACNGLEWTASWTCRSGVCEGGGKVACDDGIPCTQDSCNAKTGCGNLLNEGRCLIDGACVVEDVAYPGNACRVCDPGQDPGEWTVLEDGTPCGGGEFCVNGFCGCEPDCSNRECGDDGCGGSCGTCVQAECIGSVWYPATQCYNGQCFGDDPVQCAGPSCVLASCDPDTGCSTQIRTGFCLIGDTCYADQEHDPLNFCHWCRAAQAPRDWIDFGGACNDGNECTQGDTCMQGACVGGTNAGICGSRECGSDGCGGTCGTCGSYAVCNEINGTCVDRCVWASEKPGSWGPTGAITSLQTPADAEIVKATCFDYTGDGLGDNGLKGLAGQINGPLADAVNGGDLSFLFEMVGVTNFVNAPAFRWNALSGRSTATPPATSGDFYVEEGSYDTATCLPKMYFDPTTISGGRLAGGPAGFHLPFPISADVTVELNLLQAKVEGTVTNGSTTTGYAMNSGVLSGVLTKADLQTALDTLQAQCDAAPATDKPDFCSYLTVAKSAMALLFDMHQVIDPETGALTFIPKSKENPGDAASVCLTFSLSKAKIVGWAPVQ